MQEDYKLYINPWEIDSIQQLERGLFAMDVFDYNRNILVFPFTQNFDYYYFLNSTKLFRKISEYQALNSFLVTIKSVSFFVSAPPYAVLYPLEIAVSCPFSVYQDAVAYVLEERMDSGPRPLQHPRRGVGFVTIPDVFMYDHSGQWVILNDDANQLTIIGLNHILRDQFETAFSALELVSINEAITIMETFQTGTLSVEHRQQFTALFTNKNK